MSIHLKTTTTSKRCANCGAIAFRSRIWNGRRERWCNYCWEIVKDQIVAGSFRRAQ